MAVPRPIRNAAGSYKGESTLHMPWMPEGQRIDEGPSSPHIEFDMHTQYATVTYTWTYEKKEQERTILIASDDDGKDVTMGWSDSWHQSGGVMHLKGSVDKDEIVCKGKYSAPGTDDWGWRITLGGSGDKLTMKMYNAMPTGEEMLAVEAIYTKE